QNHQQQPGQLRPAVEVHRGEAGGGNHRGHLEGGGAYSISICGHAGRYVCGNDGGGNGSNRKEEPKLIAFKYLFDLAREDQEVQGKVKREQDHENGDDDLESGVYVGTHRQVAVGKTTGTGGAESVDKRVIQGHSGNAQAQHLDDGEHQI